MVFVAIDNGTNKTKTIHAENQKMANLCWGKPYPKQRFMVGNKQKASNFLKP